MLTSEELAEIRTAVPHLDAMALRALRRFGYDVVRLEPEVASVAVTSTGTAASATFGLV
ncbi:hypothetical protein FHR90_000062 [Endobacter medicaginis]|jgi:hypothetical protein|uniref:Uncharacterized protein n=1 Tax=Endobacter medicaginis TaxID=1181271 RepID=A0A839UR27_9PROT|nr:hypothetical protein [Endobacter medicaginis]MBB3172256.1 hypothetical protein [Endobacter medicaginis]MCX5474624.1 hypothetical protein [Endobacter medicaginis]NVN30203.1 hypothetical protein [Endobacter medicaginis]